MDFYEMLAQVIALLQREGRASYRALKRQFTLDDEYLADLKVELIEVKQLAVDHDGIMLVWSGAPTPVPEPAVPSSAAVETAPRAYTPAYLTDKILASRRALEGERKQVTVLFADIKDSTELIKDLDPEAAQQLLDPAIQRMMDAVHRFEGTVNQVLGDGIMAIFGAPIAHEDHALRACYAALAMQTALQSYAEEVRRRYGMMLRVRVGLNAGEVVVRTIGNDLYMDYSAVGQTVHLAARMEQLASPGSVLLTAATLRLVEGLVHVNALGALPVKGFSEPVDGYELIGASPLRRRIQAAALRGLTRFVGRELELAALTQCLEHAGAGHGQAVAIVGEAGVGKSRLVYECLHSHRTQGWRVLEAASVSYGKATPYFPVIDLLKRYAQIDDHDESRTSRAKLTGHVLALDESLQETLPALLALLDLLPDDSPFLHLDPPQRRQHTLAALQRLLLRESQTQPLLLVFEDLHWIDSETQALLDNLVERLPTAAVLLLVNYRPEYQHPWVSKTYYTQLRMDPLQPGSAVEVLQALLGDAPSLVPLKQLLVAHTEGNPFFLEESVRTLVDDRSLEGESGAYRLAQALPTIQVPATVQAVLAARIDRLPPEDKRLLQTAAVIGHEVSLPLLQAIAEVSETDLHLSLARLQAAELLYETRLFPEREFTFKHALTHEVAYGSLLQEQRRMLHGYIVSAFEALSPDRLAEQVERLAQHALRGEVWDKAVAYCQQAGEKVIARSAYREAVGYFEQALGALQHLPGQRATREQAIDLRLALRNALTPSGDLERILTYLHEAETLATALDDPRRLGQVCLFLSLCCTNRRVHDQAIVAAQRALVLATASGETVLHAMANLYLGIACYAQGNYYRALDCFEPTVAFFDGTRRRERFGLPFLPAVTSRAWLATCYAELGMFTEGRAFSEEGLQTAEAVAHPGSLMWASWWGGLLTLHHGDLPRALLLLERAASICHEAAFPRYSCEVTAALGAAYTMAGRVTDALPLLTQAMEQAAAKGTVAVQDLCSRSLGEAHLLASHFEEAHALADRALAYTRQHQERGHQAYALRLLGDIAARRQPPDVNQATTHYRQALSLTEALSMRPLQAHCRLGLGTLYARTGQWAQAQTELSAAIALYRAMDMTFWLPQAEAALAQVAER